MARLDISSEVTAGGLRVIRPRGKLDVFSFVDLRNYFEELESQGGGQKLVVDLAGVEFVASSGWSVLLSRRKMLRLSGGDLAICGLGPEIRRVYDSMRIQKLLPAAETLDAATGLLVLSAL